MKWNLLQRNLNPSLGNRLLSVSKTLVPTKHTLNLLKMGILRNSFAAPVTFNTLVTQTITTHRQTCATSRLQRLQL